MGKYLTVGSKFIYCILIEPDFLRGQSLMEKRTGDLGLVWSAICDLFRKTTILWVEPFGFVWLIIWNSKMKLHFDGLYKVELDSLDLREITFWFVWFITLESKMKWHLKVFTKLTHLVKEKNQFFWKSYTILKQRRKYHLGSLKI
jgi:hypothetical protein